MSAGAIIFMVLSWGFVLGLLVWSFTLIFRGRRHLDPDGTGPATPPVPARVDRRG